MNSSTIQIPDIPLNRLKDVQIKGNFTINCHDEAMYSKVLTFFYNPKATTKLKFKDIPALELFHEQLDRDNKESMEKTGLPLLTRAYIVAGVAPFKFIIKYESLHELLKLREIFGTRAGKFDTYLIEKRGYDPFDDKFYARCAETTINKVMK